MSTLTENLAANWSILCFAYDLVFITAGLVTALQWRCQSNLSWPGLRPGWRPLVLRTGQSVGSGPLHRLLLPSVEIGYLQILLRLIARRMSQAADEFVQRCRDGEQLVILPALSYYLHAYR